MLPNTPQTTGEGVNATQPGMRTGPRARTKDTQVGTKGGRTAPAPLPVTPCYGLSWLFDSTDQQDHLAAKELCNTCPIIEACMKNLMAVRAMTAPYGEIEGTWAGQLFDGKVVNGRLGDARSSRRRKNDELAYTDEQARSAHRAWKNGDRTDWVVIGNRVHNRRKKRASREKAA